METTNNKAVIVSVVMPLHNAAPYLEQAIQSVIDQSFEDWELLIVNDASTDDSMAIVEKMCSIDDRVKVFSNDISQGAAFSRNRAIDMAQGRYIAFLDADDFWRREKLETQINFMQLNNYVFTYSAYDRVDANNHTLMTLSVPATINKKSLLTQKRIGCLTAVYDVNYFGKIKMPLIKKRQDLGLWLKLLSMTPTAHGIDNVLASYRIHDKSMSANKLSAAWYTWRLFRDFEKMSLVSSVYYFSWYATGRLLGILAPQMAHRLGFD